MKVRETIMKKGIVTTLFYKYDITTTFVLLALLNLDHRGEIFLTVWLWF